MELYDYATDQIQQIDSVVYGRFEHLTSSSFTAFCTKRPTSEI